MTPPVGGAGDLPARVEAPLPRRWTLHGLNNGAIFGATYHGVRALPRPVSYAIGHAGTWIAWRSMAETRRALADNLAALFPGDDPRTLERRALGTMRSYAADTIDVIRALSAGPRDVEGLFELEPAARSLFGDVMRLGRGLILVTGHYGNWEIGSLLVRRKLGLPLAVVAMTEASPQVNRIRRQIRERLGADTIEVRQSFDTALHIRRRLSQNHIVAMLVDRHYGKDRVSVTLFGRHAWFLRTPMVMAHATGAPMMPVFIERLGPGRFAAIPAGPVMVDPGGPRDEAIAGAAQRIADALAARIEARPELWYQFYRYWDAQRDAYQGLA